MQTTLRLAAVVLVCGWLAAPAAADPPTWTARFNQGSRDAFARPAHREAHGAASAAYPFLGSHAVATDASGNIYVAGSATLDTLDHQDFLVEKYDAAGSLLWYRTTDGGSHLEDTAFCLAVSANAVFVTGESCTTSNCDPDFLTVRYDATTGNELWAKRADGPGHDWDEQPCVAVDAAGNPFVAGTTTNPAPGNLRDFLTIKYDAATGSELWRQTKTTMAGFSSDVVGALAVGADGHVVVAGTGDGENSLLTVKYNGSSGAEVWTVIDTSLGFSNVQAMALDSASNPIIVGQGDDGLADSKFLTVKYSAITGAQAWLKKINYSAGAPESAHDVAVDSSGNAYVTGRLKLFSAYTFFTVKYEALFGTELWSHNFGTGLPNDDYVPTAIAVSSATNRVIVSGYRGSASDHDFFTESIPAASATGALEIQRPAPRDDYAVSVTVDSSGNAILAALSLPPVGGPSGDDLLLVKYDASLGETWAHTEPAIDSSEVLGSILSPPELGRRKVAVDSLGNTFVVGSTASSATSTDADFLIQKYGPGGNRLWSRTVDGGFGNDFATAVVLDSAGNIFVTGWSNGNGTGYDILTMRLDPANGNTVWSKRYDGAAHSTDVSYSLALGKIQAPGGDGVFVSGASFNGARYNVTVLGYPVADGNSPWVGTVDFGVDSFAYAVAAGCHAKILGVCQPGVYVTGLAKNAASGSSGNDFMTALLDGVTGGTMWSGLLLATGDEVGYAIAAVGSPSTVAVTGTQDGDWLTAVYQGASPTPAWTIRRDFDGRVDQAHDVTFDPAGNVLVTGSAIKTPARNKQATTIKYAGSTGAELDVSRVGPIDEDWTGYGVATDFAGKVYVAGSRFSLSTQKNDFLLVRYTNDLGLIANNFLDANGSDTADDWGTALAVERNSGDAVVAGTTFGTSAAGDLLIAKYRAPEQGYFYTTSPCRLYDSRNDPSGPISGGQTRTISAAGFVGNCPQLTPAVKSLAINVTVVGATSAGYVLLYPANIATPTTSVVNFAAGQTRANNGVLNLATNAAGTFAIRSGLPPGQTVHVIVDLAGYFN